LPLASLYKLSGVRAMSVTTPAKLPISLSISVQRLLFGAIALNLISLMCMTVQIGGWLVFIIIYVVYKLYLRGLTLFGISIGSAAIVSQFAQFFFWGAKGFLELRVFRIGVIGLFFVLYGFSGVQTGTVDGYVALATVILGFIVILFTYWKIIP